MNDSRVALPVALPATWRRDWRLGRAFVGPGTLLLTPDTVALTGRRTNPLRGALALLYGLASWVGLFGGTVAMVLTTIGMGWRTRSWEWLIYGPLVGLPVLFVGFFLLRWLGRAVLEPRTTVQVHWDQVDHLATDGLFVEVQARSKRGKVMGRMRLRRRSKHHQRVLRGIELGGLPGGMGGPTTHLMRPVWVDRMLLLGVLGGCLWAGVALEPRISLWLLGRGEPRSGPLAGIPEALTPTQLEELTPGACAGGRAEAPRVVNRREDTSLSWTVDPDGADPDDWRLLHLRWSAGTGRMDLMGEAGTIEDGATHGVFTDHGVVGLSLVVKATEVGTVESILANRDLEAFRTAWCAGLIARMDQTVVAAPEDTPRIWARRVGRDQVVGADPHALREGDMVLPVRWNDRPGPDLYDLCEVPQEGGELGLLPARPTRRYRRFFATEDDQARVLLIPADQVQRAQRLARGGTVQRCLVVDSLRHAGLADALVTTEVETASLLRERASTLARAEPMIPLGGSARAAIDGVSGRYKAVLAELGTRGRSRDELRAINEGFLDAVDWTLLLDHVSFAKSLPRLEVLRQRLSGADPLEEMGERFLMHLAQAFLARTQPELSAYDDRIDVGELWLSVEQGREWQLAGRTVRVPWQRTAETYQVIGRYVLMDVAWRLEDQLNAGQLPLSALPMSWYLRYRLTQYDIALDIETSTAQKALTAWVTGDFEYLADRIFKKAAEQLRDEQAALQAARGADYSLRTTWSDGAAVRTSSLHREGREIGWVSQFDQARVELDYVPVEGQGTSTAALAGDRHLWLATSGSYVTGEGRTAGLSVVNGEVRNFLISPRFDGLVIIRGNGELAIIDMDEGGRLPGEDRRIRPLRSLTDLHTLLAWLRRDGASAFQTHLLAHEGALTIDSSRSSPTLRERRLLVQAEYQGHPIVCFVDIPGQHRQSLFEAAVTAYVALSTPEGKGGPGLRVVSIANLDVGSYDILQAFDDRGSLIRSGPVSLSSAMNLITVRR